MAQLKNIASSVSRASSNALKELKEFGSLRKARSDLEEDIIKATSVWNMGTDWGKNMAIIDTLNQRRFLCSSAIAIIRKRLKTKNAQVEILTLNLLEGIIKNCPSSHQSIANAKFMRYLIKVALDQREYGFIKKNILKMSKKQEESNFLRSQCIDKCLIIILALALGYQNTKMYPIFFNTYDKLLKSGIRFPVPNKDENLKIFERRKSIFSDIKLDKNINESELPQIKKPMIVDGITNNNIADAQNNAIFLFEIVNETPTNIDLRFSTIVEELLVKVKKQQKELTKMISNSQCKLDSKTFEDALQVNDVIVGVINDVTDLMKGTKTKFIEKVAPVAKDDKLEMDDVNSDEFANLLNLPDEFEDLLDAYKDDMEAEEDAVLL